MAITRGRENSSPETNWSRDETNHEVAKNRWQAQPAT
jgi:hypothetical protein